MAVFDSTRVRIVDKKLARSECRGCRAKIFDNKTTTKNQRGIPLLHGEKRKRQNVRGARRKRNGRKRKEGGKEGLGLTVASKV